MQLLSRTIVVIRCSMNMKDTGRFFVDRFGNVVHFVTQMHNRKYFREDLEVTKRKLFCNAHNAARVLNLLLIGHP